MAAIRFLGGPAEECRQRGVAGMVEGEDRLDTFIRGAKANALDMARPVDPGVLAATHDEIEEYVFDGAVGAGMGAGASELARDIAAGAIEAANRPVYPVDLDAPAPPKLEIIRGRKVSEMRSNQPDPVVEPFLYRGTTTFWSSAGGVGKTTLETQILTEMAGGLNLLDCEALRPCGKIKGLLVNAEDPQSSLDYWAVRVLEAYDLDAAPFDMVCVHDGPGSYPLTPTNTEALAEVIEREKYDVVVLDPLVALFSEGFKIIDPVAARAFQRQAFGRLQRTGAAILVAAHDNKLGQALSGTVDFASFARLVLHLEAGPSTPQGDVLTLTTVKANLGWRFKKLTLLRDPKTLTCRVTDIERKGDASAGTLSDPADVDRFLAKIIRTEVVPLPSERRTKSDVEALLVRQASSRGVKRQDVRDFIRACCSYESRKVGRTTQHIIVGVKEDSLK